MQDWLEKIITKYLWKKISWKKNVEGVCIHNGKLEVYVTSKYDEAQAKRLINDPRYKFSKKDLVPGTVWIFWPFWKYKTNIIFEPIPETTANDGMYRPLRIGTSIAPESNKWVFTLGCFVKIQSVNTGRRTVVLDDWDPKILAKLGDQLKEEVFVLTNWHGVTSVYSDPSKAEKDFVQPLNSTSKVLQLFRGYPELDAAFLRLLPGQTWKQSRSWVGGYKGSDKVAPGDQVEYVGRTSDYKKLTCTRTNVSQSIKSGSEIIVHHGLDKYTSGVLGGDSGSVARNLESKKAVTLINAASPFASYGHPILVVEKKTGCKVIANLGEEQ